MSMLNTLCEWTGMIVHINWRVDSYQLVTILEGILNLDIIQKRWYLEHNIIVSS